MLHIILFGAPGSGKGTQSSLLINNFGFVHLSTGDILRHEINMATPLGLQAKSIMSEGKLVSDDIVVGMIDNKMNDHKNAQGFLFDGFPRTVAQAEALDTILAQHHRTIDLVICLEVSEQELVKRLLDRGKTSGRPDDVNETIIQKRIEEYRLKTSLVADYYRPQGKVIEVQGEGSIDDIYKHIEKTIQNTIASKR